ncbi:hypothetical protein [Klebsiella pneumoniae]|uniref:hypothetical protein n=1 Tax=Klebsiella pneumoniae TaxID=573 RepID=UPI0022404D1A|nr:hypothetical protein [Klebsiella pneumoniae]
MTDITELAQSLKAAAIDAKELAIIARYSKGRAAAEKFYALANPNNVIALVEALEKAQTKAIEHGRTACELFDEVTALHQRIAELESRTVRLPKEHSATEFLFPVAVYSAQELTAALAAQGIKVEAE